MTARTILPVAALCAVAIAGGAYVVLKPQGAAEQAAPSVAETAESTSAPIQQTTTGSAASPKLYCQFYVFTEQRPRVAFYFDVLRREDGPAFQQVYVAEDTGQRTDFGADGSPRPEWRFDRTAEPPRIASTIAVPDNSQAASHDEDIAIDIYSYDPERAGTAWFEASLKNIHFQNLPGKCRQSPA